MSPLGPRDVHVRLLRAPEDASGEDERRCAAALSPDEHARMQRFRFAPDRRRYLFAHALVRATLSRYAPGTPPAAWRFRTNAYGRPEIESGATGLRFNLSHTAGLVACAVARDRDVGVDVEHVHPPRGDFGLDVAATYFAPAEVAALAAQPSSAQRERFFALWTLKEAYIKARGLGLALPLAGFAFNLDRTLDGTLGGAPPDVRIAFAASVPDDPARWHFERRQATPDHALALAVRRAPDETLAVTFEEVAPDAL